MSEDEIVRPMETGGLEEAQRWADVPVAVRSFLASLPLDPRDFLTEQEKAELQTALDRIADIRRRAFDASRNLPVG